MGYVIVVSINITHHHFGNKDSSSMKKQASSCFICYLFLFMLRMHLDRGDICRDVPEREKRESRTATGNINHYYHSSYFKKNVYGYWPFIRFSVLQSLSLCQYFVKSVWAK